MADSNTPREPSADVRSEASVGQIRAVSTATGAGEGVTITLRGTATGNTATTSSTATLNRRPINQAIIFTDESRAQFINTFDRIFHRYRLHPERAETIRLMLQREQAGYTEDSWDDADAKRKLKRTWVREAKAG